MCLTRGPVNMLLDVRNLSVEYWRGGETIPALRNVSLQLDSGSCHGIVGESGCGKSTLALSMMGLIAPHEGKITQGEIIFNGSDLAKLPMPKCDVSGAKTSA